MGIMVIYRVTATLNVHGYTSTGKPITVKETSKSYVADGLRLDKNKILRVDTLTYDFVWNSIIYHTYCLEGQQAEAAELLKAHIMEQYSQRIEGLANMDKTYQELLSGNELNVEI